jgi:hypothetical protein
MTEPKVWTKADVQQLIATRDVAVARALMVVYANQTEAEKVVGDTVAHNGVGFTGTDGAFLTSCAKFYEKAGFLTEKQLAIARNKMKKYWRQILDDMKSRGYEVSYK